MHVDVANWLGLRKLEDSINKDLMRTNTYVGMWIGALLAASEVVLSVYYNVEIGFVHMAPRFMLLVTGAFLSYAGIRYTRKDGDVTEADALIFTAAHNLFVLMLAVYAITVPRHGVDVRTASMVLACVELGATSIFVCRPILAIVYNSVVCVGYLFTSGIVAEGELLALICTVLMTFFITIDSFTRYHQHLNVTSSRIMLHTASIVDELTGLKNRRGLRLEFGDHFGDDAFVLMVDVDDFKHFNDTYGHDTGDEVLREVARGLRGVFDGCGIYRFGGDEFIVMGNMASEKDLRARAERYRSAIHTHVNERIPERIRVSMGYVFGAAHDDDGVRLLMRDADEHLYVAKDRGKDQICGDVLRAAATDATEKDAVPTTDSAVAGDAPARQGA